MARKASRVEHGLRSPVSRELASLVVVPAGRGVIGLATPVRGAGLVWVSHPAVNALVRAAARLGFRDEGEGWYCVADALVRGALPDLLSEAIEEQEDEYGRAEAV